MGPPTVNMLLLVVLCLTATINETRGYNQCSPLQRRQDLLDQRLNERDSRLSELSSRQTQFDTRFNRIDERLDGIETAIIDMKAFLQQRLGSMDRKVELALAETTTRQEENTKNQNEYTDCQDALKQGQTMSGIYSIRPDRNSSLNVYCEQSLSGGGWVVFQARYNGRVDFFRDWQAYKSGFGDLQGEFWLGNDLIHQLTKHRDQQLKIELVSPDGEVQYADYIKFYIADEADKYRLTVTGYSGGTPPGDSMATQNTQMFSTRDQGNDKTSKSDSCVKLYKGGWWYNNCHHANLNGIYNSTKVWGGLIWYHWKGHSVSLKATRMMFRKKP